MTSTGPTTLFSNNAVAARCDAPALRAATDQIIVRPAPFKTRVPREPLRVITELRDETLRRVTRAEVARFVLEQVSSDEYLFKTPFIGHREDFCEITSR